MNPPVEHSKILMQGIHVELTPTLQRAILNKFEAILRHEEGILRLNVRLQKDPHHGHRPHFRATAQVERAGVDLHAEAEGDNAYVTLDQLSDRLFDLLAREHGRIRGRRHLPHVAGFADGPAT